MATNITTYASWNVFYNRQEHPIPVTCTIAQVRTMCDMFAAAFPGVKCRPEPIGEGGVELTDWFGKHGGGYKSFRFSTSKGYPWVDQTTRDDTSFELSFRGTLTITLKAFHGAPCFSDAELAVFRRILKEVVFLPDGWHSKRLPRARALNNLRKSRYAQGARLI